MASTQDDNGLHRQFAELREQIAAMAGIVQQLAAADGVTRVRGLARKSGKAAEATLGDAQAYVAESADALHATIRGRPLQSVLVAFGIGVLAGRLLNGRGL